MLQVWEAIDAHMDDRRRAIREKKLKEDIEKYRKENPKITEQFADLKRKLAQISEDEWNAIPDIGDYTRHKKNKMDVSQLTLNALFYKWTRSRVCPDASQCRLAMGCPNTHRVESALRNEYVTCLALLQSFRNVPGTLLRMHMGI